MGHIAASPSRNFHLPENDIGLFEDGNTAPRRGFGVGDGSEKSGGTSPDRKEVVEV
jgi:hypothetical protein